MCSFEGKKNIETASRYLPRYLLFKIKRKKCEVFLMSTEGQLVNCARHTRGFVQAYIFFNLLIKFFLKKSVLERYFKKAVISSYPLNYLFCKMNTIKVGIL